MVFHSIGALARNGLPGPRFRLCSYFVGAPSNPSRRCQWQSGYGWSQCSCRDSYYKTRISFRHQQFLLKRTTFRLAYAGHLQVFKEGNVQLRDLMYTWWWVAVRFSINWCFGCTCTNIDYWNACLCPIWVDISSKAWLMDTEQPARHIAFHSLCNSKNGKTIIYYWSAWNMTVCRSCSSNQQYICNKLLSAHCVSPAINMHQPLFQCIVQIKRAYITRRVGCSGFLSYFS